MHSSKVSREEHSNWIVAMREMERAINSTRQNGDLIDLNIISRERFSDVESALRSWAISYARMVGSDS